MFMLKELQTLLLFLLPTSVKLMLDKAKGGRSVGVEVDIVISTFSVQCEINRMRY